MFYGDSAGATYVTEIMGGGCAFFDYDNDGWMDIFILGGRRLENVPKGASNRLYKNNRDGTFTTSQKKPACAMPAGPSASASVTTTTTASRIFSSPTTARIASIATTAMELFPTSLPRLGCWTTEHAPTRASARAAPSWITTATAFWISFVANYADIDLANAPKPSLQMPNCQYEGVPVNCGPSGLPLPTHLLYRNNGDGTFTDVSKESGIAALKGSYGLTAAAFDVDDDGWPDILLACDSTPSLLLMNNHDGTFREEGLQRGVALNGEGKEVAGMGVGVGDYDLDGRLDIVKTHFQKQATGLYHNLGKGEFEDVTAQAGLATERRFISWGTCMLDLDNDGFPDIFVVTGTVYPELEPVYAQYPRRGPRLVFRNLGNGKFVELGDEAGPGISARHVSRGCAFRRFRQRWRPGRGDHEPERAAILAAQRRSAGKSLAESAPGGNEEAIAARIGGRVRGPLRRQDASAGSDEPIQLRFRE